MPKNTSTANNYNRSRSHRWKFGREPIRVQRLALSECTHAKIGHFNLDSLRDLKKCLRFLIGHPIYKYMYGFHVLGFLVEEILNLPNNTNPYRNQQHRPHSVELLVTPSLPSQL